MSKLPPHSTVPLRASERRARQLLKLKRQTTFRTVALFLFITITWLLDKRLWHSGLLTTKGVALGACLNWFVQTVFTWFVFRYNGAKVRRNITQQLYIGQIAKWVLMMLGFAFIFVKMQPIANGGVIVGFISLQLIHFIMLWRLR